MSAGTGDELLTSGPARARWGVMMRKLLVLVGVVAAVYVTPVSASPIIFTAVGPTPADIAPTVTNFRTALGTLNSNVPGSFGSGRREINWDAVPDALAAPN